MGEVNHAIKTGGAFDASTASRGVRPVLTVEERKLVALFHNKTQAEMEVKNVVTTLDGLQTRLKEAQARAEVAGRAYATAVGEHAAKVVKAEAAAKEIK